MTLYVFEVSHASPRAATAPSASSIDQAFASAALPRDDVGGWVGRPRVTRRGGVIPNIAGILGDTPQNQTTAVAVYEVPDGTSLRRAVAILSATRDRLAIRLSAIDGLQGHWGSIAVSAHLEAVNGPESWWRSGEAARTRTEDAFPTLTTDPDEHPRGPTGSDTHPTTVAETLERMSERAQKAAEVGTDLLWAGAALAAVVLAGYGAWQISRAQELARSAAGGDEPTDRYLRLQGLMSSSG